MTTPMCRRRAPVAVLALALASAAAPALADPAPPFAQLLREAGDAPRLEILDAEVARQQGLALQARARPNPSVSLMVENFVGTSPYDGFNRAETTAQYSQPFELGGKRSSRVAAAEAGVSAARARGLEGRLAFATELARAYAAADIAKRRIDRAIDEVEEAQAVLKLATALVDAGKEARLRQLQAQTELNAMEAALAQSRANFRIALMRLSTLAGAPTIYTDIAGSVVDDRAAAGLVGPPDVQSNAAFLAAEADRQAATLRVEAEQRRVLPDITAHGGLRRLEGDDALALIAGVSVPLPLFDRNRGNIAAAQAEVRAAEARREEARLEAQGVARTATVQLDAANVAVAAAERRQATAEETYRLARIAYEVGKAPLSELLVARRGVGEAEDVVIDALSARFEARATLARAAGTTITGDPVQ